MTRVGAISPESLRSSRPKWAGLDWVLHGLARLSGLVILLMLASVVVVLFTSSIPSIREFGWHFLVNTKWQPNELEQPRLDASGNPVLDEDKQQVMDTIPPSFGAASVIFGTATTSAVSLILAVPLSLGAAVFLVRIASRRLAVGVSFLIEFLAAIPSIAYGIWGLFILVPFLRGYVEPWMVTIGMHTAGFHWLVQQTVDGNVVTLAPAGRDLLCGSVVLAIMIIPIITAVSRDILKQVPPAQLEGTVALGATWWQSSREMLGFARSGLFGAIMLGLARAAGETMAVTMVIGNNAQVVLSPLAPAQTMSSLLATDFADASGDMQRAALCEVALILLVMSLVFNMAARWLVVGKSTGRAGAAF
jgi:phosphate transport system permease protein